MLFRSEDYEEQLTHVFPFDDATLDIIFDAESTDFARVLEEKALELYEARALAFTEDIMHKVERDIYLQVLDNLWMQHLENMNHLREGIHWISVGQKDPLVEYRRQSQILFDAMQLDLRHQVIGTIFSAQPVDQDMLEQPAETAITKAARRSVEIGRAHV